MKLVFETDRSTLNVTVDPSDKPDEHGPRVELTYKGVFDVDVLDRVHSVIVPLLLNQFVQQQRQCTGPFGVPGVPDPYPDNDDDDEHPFTTVPAPTKPAEDAPIETHEEHVGTPSQGVAAE